MALNGWIDAGRVDHADEYGQLLYALAERRIAAGLVPDYPVLQSFYPYPGAGGGAPGPAGLVQGIRQLIPYYVDDAATYDWESYGPGYPLPEYPKMWTVSSFCRQFGDEWAIPPQRASQRSGAHSWIEAAKAALSGLKRTRIPYFVGDRAPTAKRFLWLKEEFSGCDADGDYPGAQAAQAEAESNAEIENAEDAAHETTYQGNIFLRCHVQRHYFRGDTYFSQYYVEGWGGRSPAGPIRFRNLYGHKVDVYVGAYGHPPSETPEAAHAFDAFGTGLALGENRIANGVDADPANPVDLLAFGEPPRPDTMPNASTPTAAYPDTTADAWLCLTGMVADHCVTGGFLFQ